MAWLISKSLMNSLCSLEQAAESSADACSDGKQYVPLKSTPIVQAYLCSDKTTAFSRLSRYGMTLEHLAEIRGEELLTLFRAGFRAKTLAQQEKAQESTANAADYGEKWQGSLAKYDRDSRSWKTRQCSLLEGLDVFSETWPKSGMVVDMQFFHLGWQVPRKLVKESGFFFRPTARDWKGYTKREGKSLCNQLKNIFPETSGKPHPEFIEKVMGWPIGWSELKPLEMEKFQQWLDSHGKY